MNKAVELGEIGTSIPAASLSPFHSRAGAVVFFELCMGLHFFPLIWSVSILHNACLFDFAVVLWYLQLWWRRFARAVECHGLDDGVSWFWSFFCFLSLFIFDASSTSFPMSSLPCTGCAVVSDLQNAFHLLPLLTTRLDAHCPLWWDQPLSWVSLYLFRASSF